ncbi:unnamed protein product [Porites lobata]|uniref:Uncharacterized protein n=1 Tax=Porites lobata TaxID=104759 RepID=A0ABN8QPY1_9CNID|nr:unnamed protein product [Porites lobata]
MTARIVFRIFVLALLLHSAVTQKCPAGGRSESSIVGWMLRGHVYDTLLAELPSTCVFKCREDNRCQSFNWVMSLLMCEFNNRTKEARPEDFIRNRDRSYYRRDLQRVPLGSIQELPAETCDEIKRSEGHAVSGEYWFSTIKSGTSVLAYCNMETNGEFTVSYKSATAGKKTLLTEERGRFPVITTKMADSPGLVTTYIDECSASPPVCDINANCSNTRRSYICTCGAGYTGDGKTCQVILHIIRNPNSFIVYFSSKVFLNSYLIILPHRFSLECSPSSELLADSVILGDNVHHLANLSTWLKPVAQSESSQWKRCWRASVDGWAASTFHSGCDNKGPTVTIIRVGGTYIFGGYTKLSWSASTPSTLTNIPMAFLPSIKKLYCNQCFGGLAPSLGPHAIYNISPHLRLKGVSPVNELGPGRLFEFSP